MPEKPRPMHPMPKDRARELRHHSTPPERLLWSALRGRRQESIGPYTVDFSCRELMLVVEIDGTSHEDKLRADTTREAWLRAQDYRVLRVTNREVSDDLEAVVRYIANESGIEWGEKAGKPRGN